MWSLSLGSTERRGITVWGEHPLRRRVAVGVLLDRGGGKINRCLLSLYSSEICCFLYLTPGLQFEWWTGCHWGWQHLCTSVCLGVFMCHRCASIKLSWAISAFSCFGLFCCLEWEKTVCVRYIGKGLNMYSSSPVLCCFFKGPDWFIHIFHWMSAHVQLVCTSW